MAIKLTPQQTKTVIDRLNKEYKQKVKTTKTETSDFYKSGKTFNDRKLVAPGFMPKLLESLKHAKIPKQEALPAPEGGEAEPAEQKDLFQEKGVSTATTPGALVQQLRPIMGDDKLQKFLMSFTQSELQSKPDKKAFISLEGPTEKEITIDFYIWEHEKLPGFEGWEKQHGDSKYDGAAKVIQAMSASDRNAILKKLDFDCKLKQYDDKSGWALFCKIPVKKMYYNFSFKLGKFLQAAHTRLDRQDKVIDQEELVDKLAEFFDKIGQAESEYMETEEYMESYSEYAEEDAKNGNLNDAKRNLGNELETYVDRMEALNIDEDTIKDLLIECADTEFNGGNTNSIGSFTLGDDYENQMDFDSYSDERYEDDMVALKLPYKELSVNLALLSKESAERLEKKVHNIYIKVKWSDAEDGYSVDHGTVYGGSGNSWEFIVDEDKFMPLAKRLIKDAKLAKRDAKQSEKGEASLQYPAVSAMLLEDGLDSYPVLTALLKKED